MAQSWQRAWFWPTRFLVRAQVPQQFFYPCPLGRIRVHLAAGRQEALDCFIAGPVIFAHTCLQAAGALKVGSGVQEVQQEQQLKTHLDLVISNESLQLNFTEVARNQIDFTEVFHTLTGPLAGRSVSTPR